MLHSLKPQGNVPLPDWASRLTNYYWHIRVEGRDKAKRRRFYRMVGKEKLRLIEVYQLDQEIIDMVCRYLAGLNKQSGERLQYLLLYKNPQLKFDFR